jgi:hypothetical protein
MKKTPPLFLLPALLATSFILIALQKTNASVKPYYNYTVSTLPGDEEDNPAKKSGRKKNAATAFSSRNNKVIKIYPDVLKREMHVVTKENDGTAIDFFVFDMQGTIAAHYKMNEKEHKKIAGLAPGKYVYRVFSGDTESAAGNFEIR